MARNGSVGFLYTNRREAATGGDGVESGAGGEPYGGCFFGRSTRPSSAERGGCFDYGVAGAGISGGGDVSQWIEDSVADRSHQARRACGMEHVEWEDAAGECCAGWGFARELPVAR